MRQLTNHLFAETSYQWANVGAAVTDKGIVLIDSPVRPPESRHWQNEIRRLSPLGIRYLISTDFHGDHVTGAAFIEGVTFITPQLVYQEITKVKGKHPFSKEIFVESLRDQGHADEAAEIAAAAVPVPEICFEDSLILHLSPLTFEIRRLGGHTPACSVVYVPEERVLFGSDVVMDTPCPGMRDASVGQWLKALEWAEGLPIDHIVPGHGEICGKELVRKLKGYFSELQEVMRRVVQTGLPKAEAVVDRSFEKFFWAETSRGTYWVEQRKDTFRRGLETLYDEVKTGEGGAR
jgi:cyclase